MDTLKIHSRPTVDHKHDSFMSFDGPSGGGLAHYQHRNSNDSDEYSGVYHSQRGRLGTFEFDEDEDEDDRFGGQRSHGDTVGSSYDAQQRLRLDTLDSVDAPYNTRSRLDTIESWPSETDDDTLQEMSFTGYKGYSRGQLSRGSSITSNQDTVERRTRAQPSDSATGLDDISADTAKAATTALRKQLASRHDSDVRQHQRRASDTLISPTDEHARVRTVRSASHQKTSSDDLHIHSNTSSPRHLPSHQNRDSSEPGMTAETVSRDTIAQIAASLRERVGKEMSSRAASEAGDYASPLASPARAAAMTGVHAEPSAVQTRHGSRDFAAIQRSVAAATNEHSDDSASMSSRKARVPFFGHRKQSSGSAGVGSGVASSDTNITGDTAGGNSSGSIWSFFQSGRRGSESSTSGPRIGPPAYQPDEPRPSSIMVADEIARLLPDAGIAALTTGGMWAPLPLPITSADTISNGLRSPRSASVLSAIRPASTATAFSQLPRLDDIQDDTDDILLQLVISQAVIDSRNFEVLGLEDVEEVKHCHLQLQSRVQAQGSRLALETKIREAARNLARLHASNRELAQQANDQLQASNRKVDQVATELWKLTQRASDVQRRLLEHTAGALAQGISKLETQLEETRSHVQSAATTEADTQISDRVNRATMQLRHEAEQYQREAESRQREVAVLQGELEAVSVKMQTLTMVSHAGEEATRDAEHRLTAIESELNAARYRLHSMESELDQAREQLAHQQQVESPTDLRAAVQASLRDAMLSKERSRSEAENERRLREDAERRIEELTRTVDEWREKADSSPAPVASNAEDVTKLTEQLREKERRVTSLQQQIREAAEDIDELREASQDTDDALRSLFSSLPDIAARDPPASGSSGSSSLRSPLLVAKRSVSPSTRYSFDALMLRLQNLISHHHRLTDKVLALQERAEQLHARNESNQERITAAETRAAKAEARVAALEERLAKAEDAGSTLTKASPSNNVDAISPEELEQLTSELDMLRTRESTLKVTTVRLNRELSEAQAALEQMQGDHAAANTTGVSINEHQLNMLSQQLHEQLDLRTSSSTVLGEMDETALREEVQRLRSLVTDTDHDLRALLDASTYNLTAASFDPDRSMASSIHSPVPPGRMRLGSVAMSEFQSQLEAANREMERLQRQAAEWQDERFVMEMNLEAYRARIQDLEHHQTF